jgi:ABC-type branched-subunit amino acid transport system ATPase component
MHDTIFEVKGLSKRFGGVHAIDALDLVIPRREIRALIGPNGAGKTTFINLVTGVYSPDAGEIRFEGNPLGRRRACFVTTAGIARTFQHPALFEGLSVLENVVLAAAAHTKRALLRDLVSSAGSRRAESECRQSAMHWLGFVGLSPKAAARVTSLTPAERRLLEMARAMATRPRLLLLDEPFAGMTVEEAKGLFTRVQKLRDDGVTVLVIDHNMRVLMKLADYVTVISFGRKIAEGTPLDVQASEAVVKAYLGKSDGPA